MGGNGRFRAFRRRAAEAKITSAVQGWLEVPSTSLGARGCPVAMQSVVECAPGVGCAAFLVVSPRKRVSVR